MSCKHQQILIFVIVREDTAEISDDEGIKLGRLANKVTGNMRRDHASMFLIKPVLTLTISFEEENKENFVAAGIVDIVKYMMRSDFLAGRSAQSY